MDDFCYFRQKGINRNGLQLSVYTLYSIRQYNYFFILDIHFQYNMMLQTLFLTSVYFLIVKDNYSAAALFYSILLNFKHIYLYCSIAFFIIILKNYILVSKINTSEKLQRLSKIGIITILPFIISFGPLLYFS